MLQMNRIKNELIIPREFDVPVAKAQPSSFISVDDFKADPAPFPPDSTGLKTDTKCSSRLK